MKNKERIEKVLKNLKNISIGTLIGYAGLAVVYDQFGEVYSKMGEGLPLVNKGAHLKEGNHNVVVSDQFVELLSLETPEETQQFAINGLKEACKNLSKNNSCLNFNLCSKSDEIAKKYNISKVNTISLNDIILYATDSTIENQDTVLAKTSCIYSPINYEAINSNITIRKDCLTDVWNVYETLDETLNPYNAVIYTIAVHEMMHTMGFNHIDDKYSIMNSYVSIYSPKDFTEYDKKIIDQYNVQFYGATPEYKESTKQLNKLEQIELETELL